MYAVYNKYGVRVFSSKNKAKRFKANYEENVGLPVTLEEVKVTDDTRINWVHSSLLKFVCVSNLVEVSDNPRIESTGDETLTYVTAENEEDVYWEVDHELLDFR